MPITTYIHNLQQEELHDEEIKDLLKEMPDDWIVQETKIEIKNWFKKKTIYKYKLLHKLNEVEWQIITFYNHTSSINVNASVITAFFYGYLSR